MRVEIVGYRAWSHDLYDDVFAAFNGDNRVSLNYARFIDSHPWGRHDFMAFFVGWSDRIPEAFYAEPEQMAFVLHPSPLPRYRGGSPIQHQIIAGEDVSAVTIFRLRPEYPGVDTGPIVFQAPYSLDGNLADVLARIAAVGAIGVESVIRMQLAGLLTEIPQPETDWPTMPRRQPKDSEITRWELEHLRGRDLHNKIRALQDPYPSAFIVGADGRKLFITQSHLEEDPDGAGS